MEIKKYSRMHIEDRPVADGTTQQVAIPNRLSTLESDLLATLVYLNENDERQSQVSGYSLIRQAYPDLKPRQFSPYYNALRRLSSYGYASSFTQMLPIGDAESERMAPKRLYSATTEGHDRLGNPDYVKPKVTIDPYQRLLRAIFEELT